MTLLAPSVLVSAEPLPVKRSGTPWLAAAGFASLGAGAVHFAAAGAHGEHRQAVVVFTALAFVQLIWGGLALTRNNEVVPQVGIVLGLLAVAGWALAKSVGLPVDGLREVEPVQFADASAAALAALATVLSAAAAGSGLSARGLRLPTWSVVAALSLFTAAGTVATSGHDHAGTTLAGHVHGSTTAATSAHAHAAPYDPALPIDLSGTPGVTPQQQAAAENLVAITVLRLPQWSDPKVAEAAGFKSIGDGFTGTEHLINQKFLTDTHTLDPDRPESLVYSTAGGHRTLEAAMFMLAPGTPLADVPPLGGSLVQWHIHDNLCFSKSGFIQGITNGLGQCPAGQVKPTSTPMVHVWITKNPCGPFAALEGIAGGTIAAGQSRLCDHLHGSIS